jgi:hypothetical protein
MGSTGEDVRRLQARLNEVGSFGLVVDGRFGALTRSAVLRFQRSNGLADDGIAGPITLKALGLTDAPAPEQPSTPPQQGLRRRSLHIGVNQVDPASYDGWDGALSGCENDAQTMRTIAQRDGFAPTMLLTRQATTGNVLAEIAAAAQQLTRGDTFMLSYAGHGAQVPNVSDDAETDQQDETWVLYDRMLIDDELAQAFSQFAAGVDIVMLSDSCHSGTVYRKMFEPAQLEYAERKGAFYQHLTAPPPSASGSRSFPIPAPTGARGGPGEDAEDGQRSLWADASATFAQKLKLGCWTPTPGYVSIFDRFETVARSRQAPAAITPRRFPNQGKHQDVEESRGPGDAMVATRNMPLGVNAAVVARDATLYAGIQASVRGHGVVQANAVAISGCQDSQLSQEVGGHGVFTTTLTDVWRDSSFTGRYDDLHRAIVSRMGPTQTPVLGTFGLDPQSLVRKTPFA